MKLKHIYLVSMALLCGALATGCTDENEDFDNQLFLTDNNPTTVLMKPTATDETHEFTFSIPKPAGQDVTFTVAADPSLVAAYEGMYYVEGVEMVPEANYEIPVTNGVIPAGSLKSDPIAINFKGLNTIDDSKTYVLPVTVTSCSIDILGSQKTQFYVFKKGALINIAPNIAKNSIYPGNAWATPDKFKGMKKLTVEALVCPHVLDKQISTLMGVESNFLLRFGDAGVEPNILQLATSAGNYKVDKAIELNKWTHVAMTYDSDAKTAIVYYDGVPVGTFNNVEHGPVDWSAPHSDEADGKPRCFWVGYSYNNERWFDGEISEIRIWDKVLTADEINAENHFYAVLEPEKEDNLLVYWKLDDKVNTIKDYSKYGNNGQLDTEAEWVEVSLPATE